VLRAAGSILYSLARPKFASPEIKFEDRFGFVVMPWHLDLNGHVNNAAYFGWANQARLVFLGRAGILRQLLRERSRPILRENVARYHRSLKAFDRFEIRTRLETDGNEDHRLIHEFFRGPDRVAVIESSARLLKSKGPSK